MKTEIILAKKLLEKSGITLIEAAKLVCNLVDSRPEGTHALSEIQYCRKVIECGLHNYRNGGLEMTIEDGFNLYIKDKCNLRPDSIRDIKSLGQNLLKTIPDFSKANFSEISLSDCEKWLSQTFKTPSQFNKGRAMLHGLFAFAMRHEWCNRNVVKLVAKKKVVEKEIAPLSLLDTEKIIKNAETSHNCDCAAAVGILLWAGIRPREVRRLKWRDIDLRERIISVRSQCSKTGGGRQVEICPALKPGY